MILTVTGNSLPEFFSVLRFFILQNITLNSIIGLYLAELYLQYIMEYKANI